MLIALEALTEIVFLDQAAAHEQIQRPVDGRFPDPFVPCTKVLLDIVYREVFVGSENDFRDSFALVRDRQPLLAKEAPEEPDERMRR